MGAFPPRLPEQPFFYPVATEDYAVKIARDWNVRDSGAGYVMRFEARDRSGPVSGAGRGRPGTSGVLDTG